MSLSEMDVIRNAALQVYGTTVEVDRWMAAPNFMFNRRTPEQMVNEGHADRVIALIGQLADGAYA